MVGQFIISIMYYRESEMRSMAKENPNFHWISDYRVLSITIPGLNSSNHSRALLMLEGERNVKHV